MASKKRPINVSLVHVTKHNYQAVVELCVSRKQERFVARPAEAIADMHFIGKSVKMRAIARRGVVVGFLTYSFDRSKLTLRSMMIDCKRQRR